MQIIDGNFVANVLKDQLKEEIKTLAVKLKLVVIQVGNDEASNIYVNKKGQLCNELGIDFEHLKFNNISEKELIEKIKELNNDESVTGILVQLPLLNLDENKIINAIDYRKDVDGLTNINIGKLYSKEKGIIPCTAYGIIKLLEAYKVSLEGKKACIIGRTKLVGIPLFKLLLDRNCTVTMCHSKTKDLKEEVKNSDLLVVATGNKHLITSDMIKDNTIIIDVGINRVNNKLYGDVDFDSLNNKNVLITPVPGGVGPMTVIMLMYNIIECYKINKI